MQDSSLVFLADGSGHHNIRSLLYFTVFGFPLPWKTITRWTISFSLLEVVEETFAVFPGKTDLQSFASGY